MLEAGKRGPELKNRLVGDAEMPERLLNRESLRAEDGVKYFRDTLRHPFHQRISECSLDILSIFPSKKGNIEIVKWIGKFSLLLTRLRGAWMDMLLVSAMSQEQRETQYRAHVDQRGLAALDPNSQETRDQWHATQVSNYESLFLFSDNFTTLMFIVVSDLSETQRERLTSSLSLQRRNVTVYTLDAVKTVFVELFCTPKSSMENPSLRVSGHVSSMNRTFIVEDYAQDEFGQWATDEVTGEHGKWFH